MGERTREARVGIEREEKEREFRLREQELELKKLELQVQANAQSSIVSSGEKFDVTKHVRMVPPFQEREVDQYFLHFEKIATNCGWPKDSWTMLLQSVLVGKAREIYSQLSIELSANYDTVKELILNGYELVPEAYRQKFRNFEKTDHKTYVQFAQVKEQLFDRWCLSEKIDKQYKNLRELILIEEFKRCINPDVRTFINEQKPDSFIAAARLADDFALTHKNTFENKSQTFKPPNNFDNRHTPARKYPHDNRGKFNDPRTSRDTNNLNWRRPAQNFQPNKPSEIPNKRNNLPFNTITCDYCKRKGHTMSVCYRNPQNQTKPTGFISTPVNNTTSGFDNNNASDIHEGLIEVKAKADPIMKIFEPFVNTATVSLPNSPTHSIPVQVLRDTGASQSLILTNALPFSAESYSGNNVLIKGVHSSDYNSVPLHDIRLQSDLVSGDVSIGVIDSLPFDGIQLLLGNDLAGERVTVNPIMTNKPCSIPISTVVEQEIPNLYPSCAVTRAMAKQQKLENNKRDELESSYDLSDSFLTHLFENSSAKTQGIKNDATDTKSLSTSNLINEQKNDPEIAILIQQAFDEREISDQAMGYFIKNDILMRKWRPPDVNVDDEWAVRYQIVIPKSYREEVLSLAHETPLSGHLGINKTYEKIIRHFYWPGVRKSVVEFCKTCHTCQVVGKPNQTIPKAPLKPIPAFEEPFSRIMIDCVGPLPKTKRGNQYLLTVMCVSTRFPEAIPLRNIKAKTIVQALTKFFTLVGLPKSIQSDQGSNFMSGLFQQVMHELGITQYNSSAYHPESQGALERFHQTLKQMIKTYCFETEKDWDDGVHLLLFAVRESVQESLGFSPFELVFGHTVRGPLKLLKEKLLTDDGGLLNLLQYVTDFRTKLTKACELARKNLKTAQNRMKHSYDKNTVTRNFQNGDKVLALLPVPGNPLQARYFGPYVIEKKENDLNYVIITPKRRRNRQLCHVNMLKAYHERKKVAQPVNVVSSDRNSHNDLNEFELSNLSETTKLSNSDVLRNMDSKLSHLKPSQRQDVLDLVHEYAQLFPDVLSRTDMISHDVDVGDAPPIKQHPYRLNPTKAAYLDQEIQYLLDNDFIEPSQSSWSSPCILVPKPDGSYRMCTDYRKVNNLTKSDNFPIPRIDDCVDKIGNAKYVSKFDLLKGFWQIPLSERAKEISAFVTPRGLYQYKVMPFGMRNSPATFQRLINRIISQIDGCEGYIDDVIIYSDTWEEHLEILRKFFKRLSEAKLTINLVKSEFGCGHVTYLGHIVGQGQVKSVNAKVEAIADFPQPTTKKHVMRLLGMAGYYRKFFPNFSSITEPLTQLLRKDSKFVWTEQCQSAFEKLKAMLQNAPVLSAPDFNRPFKLAVDASDVAAGAVLLQEDQGGIDHPICYFSRKFNKHQRNYSTIEKECLALVFALQHFEVYVSSTPVPLEVFSDHNPLVFLHKLKNKNQRLLRWSLILSEYDMKIEHIKGRDNLLADCLSRP